jgi:hypothetical protein
VCGEERPRLFGRAQVVGLPLARRLPQRGLGQAAMASPPPRGSCSGIRLVVLVIAFGCARRGDAAIVGPFGRPGPDTER